MLCDIDIERQSPSLQSYSYFTPSILHEVSHGILSPFNKKSWGMNLGIYEVSTRPIYLAYNQDTCCNTLKEDVKEAMDLFFFFC